MLRPGSIYITAVNRQSFPIQHIGSTPGGNGVVGSNKAQLNCHFFESAKMGKAFLPSFRTVIAVTVLVFQLDADDWAAVFVHHPFRLLRKLSPVVFHMLEILRMVLPQGESAFGNPIRKAAVSGLPMAPGTDPQPHRHVQLLTGL